MIVPNYCPLLRGNQFIGLINEVADVLFKVAASIDVSLVEKGRGAASCYFSSDLFGYPRVSGAVADEHKPFRSFLGHSLESLTPLPVRFQAAPHPC